MQTSTETTALMTALLQARRSMEAVKKHSKNPFFKSSYADWPTVIAVAFPALDANDIVLTNSPGMLTDDNALRSSARLTHAPSGQWLETTLDMPLGKDATPQSCGSAITYAQRYIVQAMLALPSTDDDGNQSSGRKVAAHPDLGEWKRTLETCKTEQDLDLWVQKNYDKVKASPHNDELNLIYQNILDKVR